MTQTFTPALDLTANNVEKEPKNTFSEEAEPSKNIIQNILNYSKNLEVKESKLLKHVQVLKS